MKRIVAGVDGSDSSLLALRWAVEEAGLRDATVEAVTAWQLPTWFVTEGFGRVDYAALGREFEESARQTLAHTVQLASSSNPAAHVDQLVVEEPAATALLQTAKGAELLVVGSRGMGGFKGLLMGSVSSHCVTHATCPVVVVRSPA
jgi:nucleotide-binding universal stress UspA family protein